MGKNKFKSTRVNGLLWLIGLGLILTGLIIGPLSRTSYKQSYIIDETKSKNKTSKEEAKAFEKISPKVEYIHNGSFIILKKGVWQTIYYDKSKYPSRMYFDQKVYPVGRIKYKIDSSPVEHISANGKLTDIHFFPDSISIMSLDNDIEISFYEVHW